jgi:hypothetical protein
MPRWWDRAPPRRPVRAGFGVPGRIACSFPALPAWPLQPPPRPPARPQSFFTRWWDEQSDATRELVKKLVREGQLDFVNGGYVQNDEAASHFVAMIDQVTRGHRCGAGPLAGAARRRWARCRGRAPPPCSWRGCAACLPRPRRAPRASPQVPERHVWQGAHRGLADRPLWPLLHPGLAHVGAGGLRGPLLWARRLPGGVGAGCSRGCQRLQLGAPAAAGAAAAAGPPALAGRPRCAESSPRRLPPPRHPAVTHRPAAPPRPAPART